MATHELTINISSGPLTSTSLVFGAVDGSADAAPDAYALSLVYDYVKSATDQLYPPMAQFSSLSDTVATSLLRAGGYWQGQALPTTGFAEALDASGLVTLAQAQQLYDNAALSEMTTRGDLITFDGINVVRLGIGAADSFLVSDGTDPQWVDRATAVGIGTHVQAYDATLQSLSGLGTGADKIAYTTAVDTWAETPLTAFGRSLIDDTDAATARTTLALGTMATETASNYLTTAAAAAGYQPLDAELTAIAGLTSAADSAPYFTGSGTAALMTVTSAARTVLDDTSTANMLSTLGGQPVDATLTALAAYNTSGLLTQIAADTFTGRTLTGPAAGITVSNGNGVAGNPTLALANDLSALEGLAGTGIAARTGSDTWAQRSITQPAAGITVTNGDGVSGNPTLALANDLAAVEGLATTGLVRRTGADTWSAGTTVATAEITDDAVTYAKMQNIATDRLLGRDAAATGDVEEISVSGGIEFTGSGGIQRSALTGDVTASAGSGSTTIANDAVTYAKLQNVSATDKVLGRSTAGAGDVEEIPCTSSGRAMIAAASAAAQTALLSEFTGDSGSGGVKGLVKAPVAGDSTKFLKGDGTWTSIPGGGDALTSSPLSQFAATTSAQLRAVLSDETGTGLAYFQGGDLGTPSAGVLTNATGLPVGTGISGLGTGVATFLATPSSANLSAALTDETGTGGKAMFSAGPVLNAGTTAVPAMQLTAGANLTTPAAGAIEFDGIVIAATAVASARQTVRAEQAMHLTANYTLTSQTAAQKLFNVGSGSGGAVNVQSDTTYEFECEFALSSMSATSGSFGFALGGTAVVSTYQWQSTAAKAALAVASTAEVTWQTNAAAVAITSANSTTAGHAQIKGKIRVTTGGTIIPQVSLGVAAAATVRDGSKFKIWADGAAAFATQGNIT